MRLLINWLMKPVQPGVELQRIIETILGFLWPPKLPVVESVREAFAGEASDNLGDGIIGPAKLKPFRDGIHRVQWEQYQIQLREAARWMEAYEKELIAQGYHNTIHDVWERS